MSFEPSTVKIHPGVWPGHVPEKKSKQDDKEKRHNSVIFHICGEKPPLMILQQNLARGRCPGRNHTRQILRWKFKGFRFYGVEFWLSPLTLWSVKKWKRQKMALRAFWHSIVDTSSSASMLDTVTVHVWSLMINRCVPGKAGIHCTYSRLTLTMGMAGNENSTAGIFMLDFFKFIMYTYGLHLTYIQLVLFQALQQLELCFF